MNNHFQYPITSILLSKLHACMNGVNVGLLEFIVTSRRCSNVIERYKGGWMDQNAKFTLHNYKMTPIAIGFGAFPLKMLSFRTNVPYDILMLEHAVCSVLRICLKLGAARVSIFYYFEAKWIMYWG